MWNVIKAQNYQIKRSNSTWYVILFGLAFYVLVCFDMDSIEYLKITGSAYFMQISGMLPFVGVAMMLVLTCKVCGGDLTDKTMNYEILGGHSRRKIYFGRCAVAMLWSFGVGYLMVLIPVLFFTVINGWGDSVSWKTVLICYGLAAFPFLRLLCGFVMLTFLVRNMYAAGILGWTFYSFSMFAMLILEAFDITATVHEQSDETAGFFQRKTGVYRWKRCYGRSISAYGISGVADRSCVIAFVSTLSWNWISLFQEK